MIILFLQKVGPPIIYLDNAYSGYVHIKHNHGGVFWNPSPILNKYNPNWKLKFQKLIWYFSKNFLWLIKEAEYKIIIKNKNNEEKIQDCFECKNF